VGYIKPDSALARAATDLLSRHAGQAGGICPSCDQMSPCPSARHAIEVRRAAGLPDTISASDPLVSGGADPLGGGSLGSTSFGGGFSGNSGYSDTGAPALAGASQSGVNSGSFAAARPVGLSKVTADAD
jgi:hypothetical protein